MHRDASRLSRVLVAAALAASGAAAAKPQIDNEGQVFLTYQLMGSSATGREAQLQVESAQWGEWIADVERPQAAGRGIDIARVDGEIVAPGSTAGKRPNSRPMVLAPGDSKPRSAQTTGSPPGLPVMTGSADRGGGALDRPTFGQRFMGSLKKHGSVEGATTAVSGADETVTVGANRTETTSGQATGRRQHKPIRARTYYDAPLPRGSVTLRLARPWTGCAVGDRFNGVYLTTGVTHKYRLDGGEIVGCGGSTVTINYTKFAAAGAPVR